MFVFLKLRPTIATRSPAFGTFHVRIRRHDISTKRYSTTYCDGEKAAGTAFALVINR